MAHRKPKFENGTDTLLDRRHDDPAGLTREMLSNRAGASSPFGETSLPMCAEDVGYQLPGEEEHTEQTEQY